MKFFKLTFAEIKKIILKPTFFLMLGCLFVAVIVSGFLFNPSQRENYSSTLPGSNLTSLLSAFERDENSDGKGMTHKKIDAKFDEFAAFDQSDTLDGLKAKMSIFKANFQIIPVELEAARYDKSLLINLRNSSRDVIIYLDEKITYSDKTLDFLIKADDFSYLRSNIDRLFTALKNVEELSDEGIENYYIMATGFKPEIEKCFKIVDGLKKISLSQEFLQQLDRFKASANDYLLEKEEKISNFVLENQELSNDKQATILQMKKMLSDYVAAREVTILNAQNMLSNFMLSQVPSDKYLGYEDISNYKLKEDIAFFTYMIDGKIDYSAALTAPNFNSCSGLKANGCDFALFLLCVASFVLDLIFVYLACSIFSGERHDGMMRMSLTKPISRNKLLFSKLCALIFLSFVAHLTLGLVFMAVGACVYGVTPGVVIAVFSASSAYAVAPFGMILLKIFTLFLSNVFYILLASMISNLCANPIFSLAASYLVLTFAFVTNTLLCRTGFVKFLPFIHTDLSLFFGGGINGERFLGTCIYSGASFPLSLIYFAFAIGIMIAVNIFAVKKQEL